MDVVALGELLIDFTESLIKEARIFHFGTLSMTHEGVRQATKKAIRIAKEAGALISFDPNLREPLWNSLEDAKEQVLYGLGQCDILKISDNEIQWLSGEQDFDAGVRWIRARFSIPLILVSMGRDGSRAYYQDKIVEVKPFLQPTTIETTGAGDTFCACVCTALYPAAWTKRVNRNGSLGDASLRQCGSLHHHDTKGRTSCDAEARGNQAASG